MESCSDSQLSSSTWVNWNLRAFSTPSINLSNISCPRSLLQHLYLNLLWIWMRPPCIATGHRSPTSRTYFRPLLLWALWAEPWIFYPGELVIPCKAIIAIIPSFWARSTHDGARSDDMNTHVFYFSAAKPSTSISSFFRTISNCMAILCHLWSFSPIAQSSPLWSDW